MKGNPISFSDPYGLWTFKWKGYSYDTETEITEYTSGSLTLTEYPTGDLELTGTISRSGGDCTASSDGVANCIIVTGPIQCSFEVDSDNNILNVDTSLNAEGVLKSSKLIFDVTLELGLQGADALLESAENSEVFNHKLRMDRLMEESGL